VIARSAVSVPAVIRFRLGLRIIAISGSVDFGPNGPWHYKPRYAPRLMQLSRILMDASLDGISAFGKILHSVRT
jgi:hypothetical protein